MKNRFIAAVVAGLMMLVTCNTVFAGIESAVCDGNNIIVTGTTSTNSAGEKFSLMLHNLYDEQKPAESFVHAEQGVSGENGAFSYTIPLADRMGDGNYTLRYGDNSGTAEEIDLYIDRISDMSISISEIGHIFFDPDKIEVNVTLSNRDVAQKNDIFARVYTEEENELVFEDIVSTLEMKAQERFSGKLTIDLTDAEKQYGMFVLEVAMVPTGTNPTDEDFSDGIRFSVAKKSDEPNNKMGIHTQFGMGRANPEINTRLLKNAGFSGIRDLLSYFQCFENGVWNEPTLYNGWVDDVNNNDLSQIIQLTTEGLDIETSAGIEAYTKYAVAVAENLTKDGVYMYELGNELNWQVSAEVYANLLMSVAPAIHNVDENVKMLAFATAGVDNYQSANWIRDVIDIIKSKGLDPHDYIDYITVHPYRPLNQAPEKKSRTCDLTYATESYPKDFTWEGKHPDPLDTKMGDSSLVARMDNLTNRLEEVECDDIPFIATEIGWYSYVGASEQNMCDECREKEVTSLDEIGQAKYSVRASALLYNKLDKIYFHTLNNKQANQTNMEKNFGFTENWSAAETEIPYEAKPVFIAMANFNAMLGNAELIEENVDGYSLTSLWASSKYDYVFQKDGVKTHMMWTPSSYNSSKTISVPGKAICIYDMYGNVVDKQYNSNGKYSITLSGAPVYVEEIEVTELKIVDRNGKAVSQISDNKELCVSMSSMTETTENGIIICATYKENVLDLVEVLPVETGKTSATTPYINTENADMVKAFYWKETNNIPYCDAVTIFR